MRRGTVGVPTIRLAVNHNSVKNGNRDIVCQKHVRYKQYKQYIPFTPDPCLYHVFNHNVINSLNLDWLSSRYDQHVILEVPMIRSHFVQPRAKQKLRAWRESSKYEHKRRSFLSSSYLSIFWRNSFADHAYPGRINHDPSRTCQTSLFCSKNFKI